MENFECPVCNSTKYWYITNKYGIMRQCCHCPYSESTEFDEDDFIKAVKNEVLLRIFTDADEF